MLDDLLDADVVFYSPVVHTPQRGRRLAKLYLSGAMHVLGNASFRYVKTIVHAPHAVLEFETVVDGITIDGVDIITWNDEHKITEFKVMVRPLKAVNVLHQRMAAMLDALK